MKILFALALVVAILILGAQAVTVQAQDAPEVDPTPIIDPDQPPTPPEVPDQIPDTAQAGFDWIVLAIAALFASFVGIVEKSIIDFFKEYMTWLDDKQRQRIGKGIRRIMYASFNLFVGVLVSLALPYIGWLDSTGVWGALLTLIGVTGLPVLAIGSPVAAELWHRLSKARV